jgi:hypothetical protein
MAGQDRGVNRIGSMFHLADTFRWKNRCCKFEHQYLQREGTGRPIEKRHSSSGSRGETRDSIRSRTSLNRMFQDETIVSEGDCRRGEVLTNARLTGDDHATAPDPLFLSLLRLEICKSEFVLLADQKNMFTV